MLISRAFSAMGPGGGRAIILMCVFTVGAQRNAVPQWESASRMSACGGRGGAGDRPDVREHAAGVPGWEGRSEEHTSELQSPMRISYAVLCLKKQQTER